MHTIPPETMVAVRKTAGAHRLRGRSGSRACLNSDTVAAQW
jgi:hypothetical protein